MNIQPKTYFDTIILNCIVERGVGLEFFRDLHGKGTDETNLVKVRQIHKGETFLLREASLEIEPALNDSREAYALKKATLEVRVNDRLFVEVPQVGLMGSYRLREATPIIDRDDLQGILTLSEVIDGRRDPNPYRVKLTLHGTVDLDSRGVQS